MVKVSTYFAMSLGAFLFWQSMDKVHVWVALHRDEKVLNIRTTASVNGGTGNLLERLEKEMEIKRVREEFLSQAKQDSMA